MRSSATLLVRCFAVLDTVLLAVLLASVWSPPFVRPIPDLLIPILTVPFWAALFRFFGFYKSHRLEGLRGPIRRIASVQLIGGFVLTVVVFACGETHRLPEVGWFVGIGAALLMVERALGYRMAHMLRSRGYDRRNVCVIGLQEVAHTIQKKFNDNPDWALHVTCVGVGTPEGRTYLSFPDCAQLSSDLNEVLRQNVIDEVLIAVPPEALPGEQVTVSLCEQYGLVARVLLQPSRIELGQPRLEPFVGEMSLAVGGGPLDGMQASLKRVIDVVLASVLLLLFAPVMMIAAVLVVLSSPGPVLFCQNRAGLHGRPFRLYKFRTMLRGSDSMVHALANRSVTGGPVFKDPHDIRLTPIGRLLRRFSIDEFPQLVNVLKGDMSMVGPRPLPMYEALEIHGQARRRFSVRPGLTCLWQVNGRSNVEFSRWMKYDLEYVDSWSHWLDMKLLLRTVPAVISGKGAY